MRLAAILGFLAVVAPISMSPGTSLTLVVSGVASTGRRHGWWVVAALLGNVLNPKAASVYLTLAPQFLLPGEPLWGPMAVLVTAHAVVVVCWLGAWVVVSSVGARLLRTDRARQVINRAGGAILVALGLRSAASLT